MQEQAEAIYEFDVEDVGRYTAFIGSSVPMKVTGTDSETGLVTCIHFPNGHVERVEAHIDELIGIGDVLEFANGVFVDVYNLGDELDDDEDEDEEEEEDEEIPAPDFVPEGEDGENRPA